MIAALIEKADEIIVDFPYFDMAHIAKAVANNKNITAIQSASLFTQNDMWLHYLLNKEQFTIKNNEAIIKNTTTEPLPILSQVAPIILNEDKVESVAVEKTPKVTIENAKKEEIIPIEPYYTVDYFAAQGVKVQPHLQPTDKLGIQVKSFTDWLKSMKKMPLTKVEDEEKSTPNVDNKVVLLAENSLLHTEILTETMAEVLVKQGKINDAIKVYEKLSLQDTTKSAYFAKRIKDLNN
jgi:hypothetical protein